MNKNNKTHGVTPPEYENNANELSDDEIENAAGGNTVPTEDSVWVWCPKCGEQSYLYVTKFSRGRCMYCDYM